MGLAARGSLVALVVALLLAGSGPAAAQSQGQRLFQEGRVAMDAGNLDVACSKFDEAFRLENSVGPLLNLAECEGKRGRLVLSLGLWKKGLARLAESDARRDIVAVAVEGLEKRVARVTPVVSSPAEGSVTVDGTPVDAGKATLVDPGEHTLELTASDGRSRTEKVTLAEGQSKSVTLALDGAAVVGAATPRAGAAPDEPTPEGGGGSGLVVAGVVSGGVGVAGLIAFGVTGAMYLGKKSDAEAACPGEVCPDQASLDIADEAKTLGVVNAVALGVGVVGLGLGGVLLWRGSRANAAAEARSASVQPIVAPTYLGMRGRF